MPDIVWQLQSTPSMKSFSELKVQQACQDRLGASIYIDTHGSLR